jgi:hypothetical protein
VLVESKPGRIQTVLHPERSTVMHPSEESSIAPKVVQKPKDLSVYLLHHAVPPTLCYESPRVTCNWGSVLFSASKVYRHLSGHMPLHAAYKWLWKSSCQNKHRVFFWLIIKGRLNTRSMLRRKNMELESYNCVLCNTQVEETIDHLFINCPFASQIWNLIGLQVDQNLTPFQNFEFIKAQINRNGNHYLALLGNLDE